MPSNFAHYQFGQLVLSSLPEREKKAVLSSLDTFVVGLYGPDVLFFYEPLRKNAVRTKAEKLHLEEAYPFFAAAKKTYVERGKRAKDKSYLFGFLCHFALDSTCHPLVQKAMDENGVSHAKVEASFERHLMVKAGLPYRKVDATRHVRKEGDTVDVVSAYLGTSAKEAEKALSGMRFYGRLLRPVNPLWRFVLNVGMGLFGATAYRDMILPRKKEDGLRRSDAALYRGFLGAVEKASDLIVAYDRYLKDELALDDRLKRNYEA